MAVINHPTSVNAGSTITISWEQLRWHTYTVDRQLNNASSAWVSVSNPFQNRFSETASAQWTQVRYRVTGMPNEPGIIDTGTSGWITIIGGPPPPDPLPTPSIAVPTQVVVGQTFTISWGVYPVGTTFEVGRSVNGGSYSTLVTSQTSSSYSDTALSSWTSVRYRVRATKGSETSSYGNSISIPVVISLPGPTVPTISMPSSITVNTSFTLSWSGGGGGTFYIDRSINGGTYSAILQNTSTTSRTETPTSSWKTVRYRIRAYLNSQFSGYAYTNTASIPVQTPTVSIPSKIMQRNDFTVSWSSATTGAVYNVERSVNAGLYTTLLTNTTTTSIIETPLDTWTSVMYRVNGNLGGLNSSWGYASKAVDLFFPKLKVMQGGSVKTGVAGWVLVGGSLRRIKDIWVMTGGVLRQLQ